MGVRADGHQIGNISDFTDLTEIGQQAAYREQQRRTQECIESKHDRRQDRTLCPSPALCCQLRRHDRVRGRAPPLSRHRCHRARQKQRRTNVAITLRESGQRVPGCVVVVPPRILVAKPPAVPQPHTTNPIQPFHALPRSTKKSWRRRSWTSRTDGIS